VTIEPEGKMRPLDIAQDLDGLERLIEASFPGERISRTSSVLFAG